MPFVGRNLLTQISLFNSCMCIVWKIQKKSLISLQQKKLVVAFDKVTRTAMQYKY